MMVSIFVQQRDGEVVAIETAPGPSLMEVIRDSGSDELLALCGGSCSCATCHVYVEEDKVHLLPAMSDIENDLLDGSARRRGNSRLSCQIPVNEDLHGMRVVVPLEE